MAAEGKQPEVHPMRLINAADVILAHRAAMKLDESDQTRVRTKALLEQFTNSELMEAADFLRRIDMGPSKRS